MGGSGAIICPSSLLISRLVQLPLVVILTCISGIPALTITLVARGVYEWDDTGEGWERGDVAVWSDFHHVG